MNFSQSVKSLFLTAIVLVGIHCIVSLSQIIANPKPNFQKIIKNRLFQSWSQGSYKLAQRVESPQKKIEKI